MGHKKSDVLFLSVLKYILKEISDEKKYVLSTYDKDLYDYTYYFLQRNSYIFTDTIDEFVEHESKFQILLTEYAGIRGYEFPNLIFLLPFGKRYLKYRMIECFSRTTTELHIIADNTRQSTDAADKQLIKKWREMDCVNVFDCTFKRLTNTFNIFTGKLQLFSEKNPFEKSYSFEDSIYRWAGTPEEVKDRYEYHDDKKYALHCVTNGDNVILLHEFCSIHGIDILTYCDNISNNLLHIAAECNAENILHVLINDYGFDVNSINRFSHTSLHRAAQCGHNAVAKFLLENGADIEARNSRSDTLLHNAVENGRTNIIQLFLKEGCQVNVKNKYGKTPLHIASPHLEAVQLLINNRADINAKDSDGQTPLHFASKWGNLEAVKLLIENGANINAKNSDGKDCIGYAAGSGYPDIIRFIKSLK